MRRSALLALLMLLVAALPVAPAAAVEQGCTQTETGYRCLYGPIQIPGGGSAHPTDLEGVADVGPSIPEAGYITSARAALVDENGDRVSHHFAHLHHAVWLNASEKDFTCASYPDRFFASGKERTRLTLPEGYGYYWSNQAATEYPYSLAGTNWLVNYHLDGMHAGHDITAYLRLNLDFVPETGAALTPVDPLWLDVDGSCGDSEFDMLKEDRRGDVYRRDWTYWMPKAGHIMGLAGHLHDGGIKLKLRNTTTDSHLFTSRALYEAPREPDYLTGMTSWTGLPGYHVDMNDVLRLRAVYDSPGKAVMGIMMGVFLPDP